MKDWYDRAESLLNFFQTEFGQSGWNVKVQALATELEKAYKEDRPTREEARKILLDVIRWYAIPDDYPRDMDDEIKEALDKLGFKEDCPANKEAK